MGNVTIREPIYDDIPLILELLYELGRQKPQKDSELEKFESEKTGSCGGRRGTENSNSKISDDAHDDALKKK